MKKRMFVFCFLLFLMNQISAQTPNIQWQKSFGGLSDDEGYSISITNDGGSIVGGYSSSANGIVTNPHGHQDFWLLKLDSAGNYNWNICLGGNSGEIGYSVAQTLDSGFIMAGYCIFDNGDVSGNHGSSDFWVTKSSKQGFLQWQKCLGGTGSDEAHSIIQTHDSGYIVVGVTMSPDGDVHGFHGNEDVFVVKLSQAGSIEWSKAYGGSSWEEGNSCLQLVNGNYIIGGVADSNDGDVSGVHNSSSDVWILELDTAGNLLWQRCYGGSSIDNAFKIISASDGGFYIAATTSSTDSDVTGNHGQEEFWLIKTDSIGSMLWEKSFGSINIERAHSVCLASDGGVIMVGNSSFDDGMVVGNHGGSFPFFPDYWVVKSDSLGNFEWGKCLGGTGDDIAYDIKQTPDGGYVIVGSSSSNDGDVTGNNGGKDVWVVKLTSPTANISAPEKSLMDFTVKQSGDQLLLRFFSKHSGKANTTIFDFLGKKNYSTNFSINEGVNYYTISCSGFAKGIYLISLEGKEKISAKVIVQ